MAAGRRWRSRQATPFEYPDGVSDEIAAGIPVTYGTALFGLGVRGRTPGIPGETVAVLGAAGGAGLAAVNTRASSTSIIAVASSEDKLAIAKAHGAAEGIDYQTENMDRMSSKS